MRQLRCRLSGRASPVSILDENEESAEQKGTRRSSIHDGTLSA